MWCGQSQAPTLATQGESLFLQCCISSQALTLATLRATRYFCPSFSSSARTQSVRQGVHSAYRQSIMPCTRSICMGEEAVRRLHIAVNQVAAQVDRTRYNV